MLEATLVRKHRPRYNIILRDDKHYPFLKLTTDEPFPRLVVARRVARDGATYYGPFYPATAMRETLRLTRQLFPLRTCSIEIDGRLERPCIQYHIGRCRAPCTGWETQEGYARTVAEVERFLEGKDDTLAARADRGDGGGRRRPQLRARGHAAQPGPGPPSRAGAPEDDLHRRGGPGRHRPGPAGGRRLRGAVLRAPRTAGGPGGVLLRPGGRAGRRGDPLRLSPPVLLEERRARARDPACPRTCRRPS